MPTTIARCSTCGQTHGDDEPCSANVQPLPLIDDVALDRVPDPIWDIDTMIQEGVLEVNFGPSDVGKTTVLAARAFSKATGLDFYGKKILQSGPVIYAALEGISAFKKKVRALKKQNGYKTTDRIGIYTIRDHFNLLQRHAAYRLIKSIEQVGAQELIADTLAQSICADEDNAEMGLVVAHCNLIRRETGARVVLNHHTGKDRKRGARGGSALTAAADTVISLDELTGGLRVLRCVRQRDGKPFDSIFLKLVPVGDTVLFELAQGPTTPIAQDKAIDKATLRLEIVKYLETNPRTVTSRIAEKLKKRRVDVMTALDELKREGKIDCEDRRNAKSWSVVKAG